MEQHGVPFYLPAKSTPSIVLPARHRHLLLGT